MSRYTAVTMPRFFISITIFLYLVCLVSSSHKINQNFRNVNIHKRDKNSKSHETQESIMLNRLLEPYIHKTKYSKKNQHVNKKFDKYILKPHGPQSSITSCGKITCEYVEDYPEELIRVLYYQKFYLEQSTASYNPLARGRSFMHTYSRNPEINYRTINVNYNLPSEFSHSEEEDVFGTTYNHKRPNCDKQIKETYPKEGYNDKQQPKLLVSLDGTYRPKAIECLADEYCKDSRTPDHYVNYCNTTTRWEKILTLNKAKQTLEEQRIEIPNGCDCKLIREPKV